MPKSGRIAIVLCLFAVAVALVLTGAFGYVGSEPVTVSYLNAPRHTNAVDLTFQTDGALGTGVHPTWVSYRTQTPSTKQWVHTTLVELPVHTRINVTIYQFDSGSPLRNQQFGEVFGTTGTDATLNGKTFKVINSNTTTVGHTFTIPSLGLSVPLRGVDTSKPGFCTAGPCNPTTQLNNKITFSFMTPNHPGNWRFQCFIPCGAGWYAGNGGPMQTLGYMGGFLEVRA